MMFGGRPSLSGADQRRITVLIADDHPVVRDGIRRELEKNADLRIVGEAADGDQALNLAMESHPDVLLLDINMPGIRAVQVVRALRSLEQPPRILVLSAYSDLEYVFEMLKAGVNGYLLKDEDPSRISEGIREVAAGRTWLSSAVAETLVDQTVRLPGPAHEPALSPREAEVLRLMARGLDNLAIAGQLSISEGTVKNHVSNLYSKLGVNSRAEAVAWAWRQGLMRNS